MVSKRKGGKGKFPPNPNQWDAERNGLKFRSDVGLDEDVALNPYELPPPTNVELVATRKALAELVDSSLVDVLYEVHGRRWSGMTIPCDDDFVVVMNEWHAKTRRNATLMEELFHIRLQHKPSRVGMCPHTGLVKREFDRKMETEAYHSAAAALLPYSALKQRVQQGRSATSIGQDFVVSADLVRFRMKVCKLWHSKRRLRT